ncbi:MAG: EamA family transporter [Bryobacterales bacterium]|nr:EamA family transporter [Bryobacterales bacterium]
MLLQGAANGSGFTRGPIDKLSVALAVIMAFAFLGEKPSAGSVAGAALITVGVLVTAFVR